MKGNSAGIAARRLPLARIVALLVLAACGSESSRPHVNPPDCSSVADTTAPATVSFVRDIQPILERESCGTVGCHNRLNPGSGYLVETYDALFMPGEQAQGLGLCEIKPGLPDSSYLYWKLEGRRGIREKRMPQDRPALSASDLELFRLWITEGARNTP